MFVAWTTYVTFGKFLCENMTCFFLSFCFLVWIIFKVFVELLHYCFFCLCSGFLNARHVGGILTPQPGIKPSSPALEVEVLTTVPPGKSHALNIDDG